MGWLYSLRIGLLLSLLTSSEQSDPTCSTFPRLSSGNWTCLEPNLVAAVCDFPNAWVSNSQTIKFVNFAKEQWNVDEMDTCGATVQMRCILSEFTPPSGTQDGVTINDALDIVHGIYYKCLAPNAWISGKPGNVVTCQNGVWEDVFDSCEESCIAPRDCSDVTEMGFTEPNVYVVMPTPSTSLTVECIISGSSDADQGRWTLVLRRKSAHNADNADFNHIQNGVNGTNGFEFLGYRNLNTLSTHRNGTERPLVLRVLINTTDGEAYHATYDEVIFNTTHIVSLGNYHGNAGDVLTEELHKPFLPSPTEVESILMLLVQLEVNEAKDNISFTSPAWSTVEGEVEVLEIWVRPRAYDAEFSCPSLPELSFEENTVKFDVPLARTPGTVIKYKCIGDYMFEASSDGPLKSYGEVTCSNELSWAPQLILPCKLVCPDGFVLSPQETSCYHFAEKTATNGYISSVLECGRLNASLAEVTSISDWLQEGITEPFYFTNHRSNNGDQTVAPALPEGITDMETQPCEVTATEECIVMNKDASCLVSDCTSTEHHYVCSLPVTCPENYNLYRGICYSLGNASEPLSVKDALSVCREEGSSLAYPENLDALNYLVSMVQTSDIDGYTPVLLGMNDAIANDWTVDGLFAPNEDVIAAASTSDSLHWRKMIVPKPDPIDVNFQMSGASSYNSDSYMTDDVVTTDALSLMSVAPPLEPISLESSECTHYICQYQGPSDCWSAPPAPLDNMERGWDTTTFSYGHEIIYSCNRGTFVSANISVTEQTVTCVGQLGQWYPATLDPCIATEVCSEPMAPSSQMVTTKSENALFYQGHVNFTCPDQMTTASNAMSQTLVCEFTSDAYSFSPSSPEPCDVCMSAPHLGHSTSDWTSEGTYTVRQIITATCPTGQHAAVGEATYTINCTDTGWEVKEPCYVACVDPPPTAEDNMEKETHTTDTLGTTIQYNCADGMFVPPDESYTDVVSTVTATCEDNQEWSQTRPTLKCDNVCQMAPPDNPASCTSSWDGYSKVAGTEVTYTCDTGMLFLENSEESLTVTCGTDGHWTETDLSTFICNYGSTETAPAPDGFSSESGPHWLGDKITFDCPSGELSTTGTNSTSITYTETGWTELEDDFACYQTTNDLPSDLPPGTVVAEGSPLPPFYVGIGMNLTCQEGMVSPTLRSTNITLTVDGWTQVDSRFNCINATFHLPVLPPVLSVAADIEPPFYQGMIVNLICKPGLLPYNVSSSTTSITYTGDDWTLPEPEIICIRDPNVPYVPLPTEPPVEFPDVNAEEQAYSDTADMHVASLNTAMEDVNGVPDNFGDTIGPFGFGKSVNLSSAQQQCLKKINYGPEGDCSMDPSLCTNGFSISIWEKAEFDEGHFYLVHKTDTENKRYIISTGGDEYGHPGLSLYHQGLALKAVVSTGDMFWTARAFGAVPPGVWTNLGIRWTQSFGLELYVNTRRVGQGKIGYTSTRQEPLNPSELIVGCHKTSSDPVYRDFNNAEFDELAIWTSALPDENLVYFLGGYNGEMKHLSPKEYEFMLKQTDMGDPRQAQRAFAVLGDISRDALKPVVTETTENGTSSSTASENAAGATVGVSDRADRLQPWVDVVESMTSINNVKDELPSSEMPAFAGIIHPISNLMNESAAEDWERYQKENIGSPFVMKRMEEYLMYTMRNIRFKNQELSFSHVEVADNIVASMDKLLIRDYEYNGKFVTPNLKKIPEVREGWGGFSKAEIPNTLFKNHHCGTRPVNILSNLYKDLDHIAPMRLNPKTLNTGVRNALDSRVLSVNVIPDPPVYPGDSWCYPSQKQLQEDPLLLVLEHLNPQDVRPSRKLLFHENETLSDLAERHCVWWNARHGDLGAWDTEGCTKMESTVYFTKCTCSHFGVFSVMAEETETIEVPDEPFWLTIVRYTLYSISALCLILYIAVVGLSGDLKDQFHMTGLNLAAVLLAGSVFMIISDFESIRENRHACTIIGSFLHIFYLVAGGWIAVLGHAVFKSITSGIIQGLMNQYFLIPWGVTFMSFGLSYAAYLQDLGTDPRCFISWYNDVKHIFFFPLVICILVANFCAITIFFNLKTTALRGNPAMKEYMSFSIGGAVLVFYFTFTWIIGMFTYYQWESSSYIYPVFQIFNGLMGVVLLVCIGFLSSRFKMVLAGQAKRRKEMLMNMRKELSTKSDDKKKLHQRKGPKAKKVRDSQGEPPAASLRRPSNVDLEEERIGTWIPNEL